MINKDVFINYLSKRGIACTEEQYALLIDLMLHTLKANEEFNLTAIKDADEFQEKMLIDSALVLNDLDFTNKSVIDVGTGAGFPGMVLYLLNRKMDLTLLDSTNKKIEHLRKFTSLKKYDGINLVCDRAEVFAHKNIEKYDYATARALAHLSVLVEIIVPMLKIGGTLVALKGPGYEKELEVSLPLMRRLGCTLDHIYEDELLESGDKRFIIYIKKIRKSPARFPREYSEIKKGLEKLK